MTPVLREGRLEDLAACASIYERVLPAAHPGLGAGKPGKWEFQDSIAGEELWVAEGGKGLAGLVTIWRPDAFIHHLYIEPAWQRRGIGRMLLQLALRRCGGHAELKCDEANRAAHGFYLAAGWRPAGWGWSPSGPWLRFRH